MGGLPSFGNRTITENFLSIGKWVVRRIQLLTYLEDNEFLKKYFIIIS